MAIKVFDRDALVKAVLTKLNEDPDNPQIFNQKNTTEVVDALNENLPELVEMLPDEALLESATIHQINTTISTTRYTLPVDGSSKNIFLRHIKALYDHDNNTDLQECRIVNPKFRQRVIDSDVGFTATEEYPIILFIPDLQFEVYPAPTSSSANAIEIWCYIIPDEMTAGGNEPKLLSTLRPLLISMTAWKLSLTKEGYERLAIQLGEIFFRSLNFIYNKYGTR